MKNALVILAGGKGVRFSQKIPKQFYKIGNTNIISLFLSKLDKNLFDYIVISIDKKYRKKYINLSDFDKNKIKILFSEPGKNRQKSSYNALKRIRKNKIDKVLIHDAARPFCSNKLIKKILKKLDRSNNVIPIVEHNDRQIKKSNREDTKVINIQTPQGFRFKNILEAHTKLKSENLSDDSGLLQKLNYKINFIKGEKTNLKITYPDDIKFIKLFSKPSIRSGIGYDIHRFDIKTNKGLKLCGIKIPYSKLIGHSDADAGLHAICDAIFGSLSMRDIGYHFPNTKKKWKNADSSKFIIFCKEKLIEKGFCIINLDVNIIAESPKINKYVVLMKKRIAKLLNIKSNIISIKATTNEKIGFIGNGEGIATEAVVQISNENFN